jgi:CheY-like chemotaxis protein/HPt (histidine-containing phosphotransfer) domain-containing protein
VWCATAKPVKRGSLRAAVSDALFGKGEFTVDLMPSPKRGQGGQGIRVLLVEDNPVNQRVAVQILSRMGCSVDAVGNGLEALGCLEKAKYDVVLMDCQMPEMDGYEATREIRLREGNNAHVWVIAMTAHSLAGDREKCLAAGMDDYISKPVRPSAIEEALQRAVRNGVPSVWKDPIPRNVGEEDSEVLARLAELDLGDGGEFVRGLVDLFLATAPAQLRQIREAFSLKNTDGVACAAHALRGSCSNFAASRLQSLCLRVERTAMSGGLEEAKVLLEEMEEALYQLQEVLKRVAPPKK